MTTSRRGLLFHFTHISNLASVVLSGLTCDSLVNSSGTGFVEVGNQTIKEQRRNRTVPLPPHGVVADYVPFYFAARSPMLYSIYKGNVSTYVGGQDEVVYLVTDIDTIVDLGLPFVFTDRNAALQTATYSSNVAALDALIDWSLMESQWFMNTPSEPDRRERRMAELLVHHRVSWSAILGVAVKSDARARQVFEVLASVGANPVPVETRPNWYF